MTFSLNRSNPGLSCDACGDQVSYSADTSGGGVGFYFSGWSRLLVTTIDVITKINLYHGAVSLVSGQTVDMAMDAAVAYGNGSKGYVSGGIALDYAVGVLLTERMDYTTEVLTAVATADLSTEKYFSAAVGESTKGFIVGGALGTSTTQTDVAERNTYSTEVTALVAGANATRIRTHSGHMSSLTDGYILGGFSNGFTQAQQKATDKLVFASETTSAVASADMIDRPTTDNGTRAAYGSGNLTTGYLTGDWRQVFTEVLTYATDTMATGTDTVTPQYSADEHTSNLIGAYLGTLAVSRLDYATGITYVAGATVLPDVFDLCAASTGIFT